MNLDLFEQVVGWAGMVGMVFILGILLYGIWRGTQRPINPEVSGGTKLLRSPFFYFFSSILYFGLCYILWVPINITLTPVARITTLILGGLLFFSGLGLILWGRLALGGDYFVSTSRSAPLFIDHKLITTGPFAYVRHPIYMGILLTGIGGMLLYRTWTMVFIAANFFGLIVRARREEEALAREFGWQWSEYCKRVPAFVPRIWKKNSHN